jgi:hypothetical protein
LVGYGKGIITSDFRLVCRGGASKREQVFTAGKEPGWEFDGKRFFAGGYPRSLKGVAPDLARADSLKRGAVGLVFAVGFNIYLQPDKLCAVGDN